MLFLNNRFRWRLLAFALSLIQIGRADSNFVSTSPHSGYALVGLAKVDGVVYACLLDQGRNEHFVLSNRINHDGMSLVSVSPLDVSVLSVVVHKGDSSITLKMGEGTLSSTSTIATAAEPSPLKIQTLPPNPTDSPLPLLFRVSVPTVSLDEGQQAAVKQLRQDFIERVKANSGTTASPQVWKQAQRETDEETRTLLGDDIFTRLQIARGNVPFGK